MDIFLDFASASIRAGTPLIFCALAVLLAERSGVTFLGVEGMMLIGALTGFLGALFLGSIGVGLLLTIALAILFGLLLSVLLVRLPTDQIVIGIAFNITALGLTSYVFRLAGPSAVALLPYRVEPLLFGLTFFELLAIVLAIICWWFLFKTGPGLKVRSTGESVLAASAAGINIIKVRTTVLIVSSSLAAMGGAALSVGWVRTYMDNISMGRGFIALAAVYFGRWHPIYAALAAILFGAGEALAFRAQAWGIPLNIFYLRMVPYMLTIIAIGIVGKSRGPADCGKIFLRR